MPARTVKRVKQTDDDYLLRLLDDRVTVEAAGVKIIEVAAVKPIIGQNLLLVTHKAKAAFDNVRIGPIRWTDFDDSYTAPWTAVVPSSWQVVSGPGGPPNRVWEATVPAKETRQAVLDRFFGDFTFRCNVNLKEASRTAVRFRTENPTPTWSPGYTLYLTQKGEVTLERTPSTGPAIRLGSTTAPIDPGAVALRIAAQGDRVVVGVDNRTVLDVTDTGDPPEKGFLHLVAWANKVRFDNLRLEAGPNRFPAPRFVSPGGSPLPAGFVIDYVDPDGWLDLTRIQFELSLDGRNFLDLTLALHPFFGLFTLAFTPDGKGYRFTLASSIPTGPGAWTLRATALDRTGNCTVTVFKTGSS